MNDIPWHESAPNQIILNSIFAALAGVLITVIMSDGSDEVPSFCWKFIELISLLLSFVLSALSAEQTVNALDENDVKKYVYYMLVYNLAVILLGLAFGILIYVHFINGLIAYFLPAHPCIVKVSFVLLFLVLFWHWLDDICWLLCADHKKITNYLNELEGKRRAEPEHSCLLKLFYRLKK
jgi:hypothetical protein